MDETGTERAKGSMIRERSIDKKIGVGEGRMEKMVSALCGLLLQRAVRRVLVVPRI
jgi:hypothetical protein